MLEFLIFSETLNLLKSCHGLVVPACSSMVFATA